MSKVVISGSSRLQDKISFWRNHFEEKGHTVIAVPKVWDAAKDFTKQLAEMYVDFYDALDDCDVFFLMNEDKNNTKGYIGANATAELIYVTTQKLRKRSKVEVYILQEPAPTVMAHDEVMSYLRAGWIGIYEDDATRNQSAQKS